LPTGVLTTFEALGFGGFGEKPPQNLPSVRSTSKEGTTFERKPMSLQP
jgi:hypothetical protein